MHSKKVCKGAWEALPWLIPGGPVLLPPELRSLRSGRALFCPAGRPCPSTLQRRWARGQPSVGSLGPPPNTTCAGVTKCPLTGTDSEWSILMPPKLWCVSSATTRGLPEPHLDSLLCQTHIWVTEALKCPSSVLPWAAGAGFQGKRLCSSPSGWEEQGGQWAKARPGHLWAEEVLKG